MATTNYGLPNGHITDDFVQPGHVNDTADAFDRIAYHLAASLLANSVISGWTINSDKTVAAGAGFVGGCYCVTGAAQAITGLTNGTLNYVFAQTDGASPEDGTVVFHASISASKTAGHILLGTITLDGGGAATATCDTPNDNDRGYFALKPRTFSGSGSISNLPGGSYVDVEIDHAAQGSFHGPGALAIVLDLDDIAYEVTSHEKAAEFTVRFTNDSSYIRSPAYTWERKGIAV